MKTHGAASCTLLLLSLAACSGNRTDAPETRRVDVVDEIHGESIPDPYRWLEDQESAETRAWLDAQNAYAERVIGESPRRARLRERLSKLMRSPEVGSPEKGGDSEYFAMRRAQDELEIVFRRPVPPEGELLRIDPDGQYEVVIDPHPMSADLTTKVEILSVSSDGRLLLYGLRDGGQDEIEVRLRDVEAGEDLGDRLPTALYSGVAFGRNDEGFYYTHRSRVDGPRVKFHVLGDPLENDETIFGEGYGPTSFVNAREVGDGKYVVLTVNHGWARSELHLQDLGTGAPARPLAKDVDARFEPQFHEGLRYVRTNLEASNNRVLAIDPAKPERESWKEVLPESSDVLTDFAFLDGKIYASYLHEVSSRIRVFALDGTTARELAVPEHHSAQIRGAVEGKAFLELSSFHRPPITYLVDLESGERELWQERELEMDTEALVVEQVPYRSADGTEVPMYLFYREGLRKNGKTPTILFGYGGFNVALTPRFDPMALVWVEHGGLYAMANLRGGSEYGEKWHRDGMLENKQNVFDDFITAAEFLIDEGYTAPDKLAIRGTSNGGVLVASAMTQRPDLYRAVLCGFPDLDMVRFYAFTRTNNLPALLEYGDASIPEQFAFIRKYSPYQAIREGAAYPAVMLTSGDRDTRVPPLQARKMTARLQHATSSGRPIILKYHPKAGHAASRGLPLSSNVEDTSEELEFLMGQLDVALP
ncbi:MAG TPA: prolyl oligopeptidase family serine peptidase [Vicinamibacteria bacterium]|nr:prolyl oligopeptidase family serine peptidase [Vicinamibacteria bacterium]